MMLADEYIVSAGKECWAWAASLTTRDYTASYEDFNRLAATVILKSGY